MSTELIRSELKVRWAYLSLLFGIMPSPDNAIAPLGIRGLAEWIDRASESISSTLMGSVRAARLAGIDPAAKETRRAIAAAATAGPTSGWLVTR